MTEKPLLDEDTIADLTEKIVSAHPHKDSLRS